MTEGHLISGGKLNLGKIPEPVKHLTEREHRRLLEESSEKVEKKCRTLQKAVQNTVSTDSIAEVC